MLIVFTFPTAVPATIKSDISNVASTLAGICVDFAESSMLAEDLVADLFETAGTEKESEIRGTLGRLRVRIEEDRGGSHSVSRQTYARARRTK